MSFKPITSRDTEFEVYEKLLARFMVVHYPQQYLVNAPGLIEVYEDHVAFGIYGYWGPMTLKKHRLREFHFELQRNT